MPTHYETSFRAKKALKINWKYGSAVVRVITWLPEGIVEEKEIIGVMTGFTKWGAERRASRAARKVKYVPGASTDKGQLTTWIVSGTVAILSVCVTISIALLR